MEAESKEYSWAWVTADRLLSHGPCELLCAIIFPAGTGTCNVILYDGENATGEEILNYSSPTDEPVPFSPPKPIYCRRGLYVGGTALLDGIFVQWRELGQKGGE